MAAAVVAAAACSPAPDDASPPEPAFLLPANRSRAPSETVSGGPAPTATHLPGHPPTDGFLRLVGVFGPTGGTAGLTAYVASAGRTAQFYRAGDRLPDGSRVREVQSDAVVVEGPGGRRRLDVGQGSFHAPPSLPGPPAPAVAPPYQEDTVVPRVSPGAGLPAAGDADPYGPG